MAKIMIKNRKVILLGLDGATFDLFQPWMAEGLLPNMRRLAQGGVWGELRSTTPPTTPTAWSTCVTGKNPGKHGIFDFRHSPLTDPTRPLINGRSVQGAKLWHILNAQGLRTNLLNVPITYPPEPVRGVVVSGMMTPGPEADYTHPPHLKAELLAAVRDYVPNVDIAHYDVNQEVGARAFLKAVTYAFERRREAMDWLMDNHPWDFFMVVYVLPDRIQHLFWKYLDPTHPEFDSKMGRTLRPLILNSYQLMDEMLGQLLARLDQQTNLFIVSDHGFGRTEAYFNVNSWLAGHGWLSMKANLAARKRLFYELMRLEEHPLIRKMVPANLANWLKQRIRRRRSAYLSDVEATIDWSQTKAFFPSLPCQGIYINRDLVASEAEYQALRDQIKGQLFELSDPQSGEPIMDAVYFREEVYQGPQTALAPDILFVARDYAYLGRALFGSRYVVERTTQMGNGFHRMNGLFMAYGPDIKAGFQVQQAEIADVAPTVLYAYGLAVPQDMDGQVLTSAFQAEVVATRPVSFSAPMLAPEVNPSPEQYRNDEEAEIAERLRALGYLD
jgi:predicted AlkP superfamily phosphohydrolase/phosphomutase